MAHRRSFRGRGISDSQRRKKTWISTKITLSTATAGRGEFGTSLNIQTGPTSAFAGSTTKAGIAMVNDPSVGIGGEFSSLPEECTILRARGSLLFPKSSALAGAPPNSVSDQYAFGFGVTDVRSLDEGSFPGPILDSDWDGWMFLRQSQLPPIDAAATIVDVKAMRKIQTGDAVFFAAEAVSGDTTITPAADWFFDMRFLVLLP